MHNPEYGRMLHMIKNKHKLLNRVAINASPWVQTVETETALLLALTAGTLLGLWVDNNWPVGWNNRRFPLQTELLYFAPKISKRLLSKMPVQYDLC